MKPESLILITIYSGLSASGYSLRWFSIRAGTGTYVFTSMQ